MEYIEIRDLLDHEQKEVQIKGWVYNKRGAKSLFFLVVRDGSGLVQCVVSQDEVDEESWNIAQQVTQESSIVVYGAVRKDERQVGGAEVQVIRLELISLAEEYPLTPKAHGVDFLMKRRHLWLRSRRQWAIMRVRNRVIVSIHHFFQDRGFVQMDAPILTGNAVEGTSNLFELDYFGEPAYLTQSGQLYGEAMAMAFGKIYTFGPTFRAERSKTRRHLTEFWMIEPEMAFYDLEMNMQLVEDFIVSVVGEVLSTCKEELEILERDLSFLKKTQKPFPRLHYSEAVALLKSDKTWELITDEINSLEEEKAKLGEESEDNERRYNQVKKGEKRRIDARQIEINLRLEEITENLRNLPEWRNSARNFEWGSDFGGSDETILTRHFDRPIIVHRYPSAVKAFYMKRDPVDERLALGMDVLAPEGYGEIVGGGERATDIEFLKSQITEHQLPMEVFEWYIDLRRYGSVPHSGFGLGLERLVSWICGLQHVRETIPFPRLLGRIEP